MAFIPPSQASPGSSYSRTMRILQIVNWDAMNHSAKLEAGPYSASCT